jgi:oligopeptide/dipeptide ABC transporter ATP-binding protein
MDSKLLEVNNLKKYFPIRGGIFWKEVGRIYAVDDVSFSINKGETLGLVGESGCGKTTVGRTIINLYKPTSGKVFFETKNIYKVKENELRTYRRNIQIIFQDPFESLNPRHTIGTILEEPFLIHKIGSSKERKERIKDLLNQVGLSQDSLNRFPHEFSGGQRQRIGIARAISLNPKLIICDEPVSALDVSIQSQILNLLLELQEKLDLTYLFIAHDLAVVKHISDKIAVMYLGKIVEYTDTDSLYLKPVHPYSQLLLSAIPIPDPAARNKKRKILTGDVPSPANPPNACRFHTRCPIAIDICRNIEPLLEEKKFLKNQHLVSCHRADEILENKVRVV